MKLLKKINSIFTLSFVGYLLFSVVHTGQGFIALDHHSKNNTVLMEIVHEESWTIGYMYSEKCAVKDRPDDKKLQHVITEALQIWLQPLRAYTKQPIVNNFHFLKLRDWDENELRFGELKNLSLRFGFYCKEVVGIAQISNGLGPEIEMQVPPDIGAKQFRILLHELGHAMGLDDTYVGRRHKGKSTGGLPYTIGKQPHSMMAARISKLLEDDKRGIVWLYKHLHEGLEKTDCFFSDYEFEADPTGCRPKHPLLFEFKQGISERHALDLVGHDKNINLNARDRYGMTGLHYAVSRDYQDVVKALLNRPTIKVNIINNKRQTAAQLARMMRRMELAKLIEAHPTAKLAPWAVAPGGKLATTWGRIKQSK